MNREEWRKLLEEAKTLWVIVLMMMIICNSIIISAYLIYFCELAVPKFFILHFCLHLLCL
jgi:hypothetical protein